MSSSKKKRGEALKKSTRPREREIVLQPEFLEDLQYWAQTDPRMLPRLLNLMQAIRRDPFTGIGKPEAFKHELAGAWSRRLNDEHRIVYLVREGRIDFLQARYHYTS